MILEICTLLIMHWQFWIALFDFHVELLICFVIFALIQIDFVCLLDFSYKYNDSFLSLSALLICHNFLWLTIHKNRKTKYDNSKPRILVLLPNSFIISHWQVRMKMWTYFNLDRISFFEFKSSNLHSLRSSERYVRNVAWSLHQVAGENVG